MSVGSPSSRIYLLRHARSAWALPGERDLDRALDGDGRQEAEKIAGIMVVNGFIPAQVLCSPARRCVETWEIVEKRFALRIPVRFSVELYAKDHEDYVDLIASAAGPSVMVIGHNPMMDDTARALVCRSGATFDGPLAGGYPTGGLAIVDLPGPMASAASGMGRLVAFLAPGDC